MARKGKVLAHLELLLFLVGATVARFCPDPSCPEDQNNNQTTLLPSADCKNFYSCTWGFPTLLGCPPGLRFNENVPGCVPKEMADCSPCEDTVPVDTQQALQPVGTGNSENTETENSNEGNTLNFINFFPFLN